jgi:hypothetical protein
VSADGTAVKADQLEGLPGIDGLGSQQPWLSGFRP